jgi:hypothetical protein
MPQRAAATRTCRTTLSFSFLVLALATNHSPLATAVAVIRSAGVSPAAFAVAVASVAPAFAQRFTAGTRFLRGGHRLILATTIRSADHFAQLFSSVCICAHLWQKVLPLERRRRKWFSTCRFEQKNRIPINQQLHP